MCRPVALWAEPIEALAHNSGHKGRAGRCFADQETMSLSALCGEGKWALHALHSEG